MQDAKNISGEGEQKGTAPAMDQAASYLAQGADYPPMTPEEEKRMLRKMDWILLPMVSVLLLFPLPPTRHLADHMKHTAVLDGHLSSRG